MAVTWKNGTGVTPTWNRLLPVCAMGAPTGSQVWSQSYGGKYAVAADGYVFWTRSNRYIDKIDPADGSIVLTRDFGAGSYLAEQLCACDVAGVPHIYCTTAYTGSSALCRAIKTSDLTDYWTQAWTGVSSSGMIQQTFYAFETASGVLIVGSDNGSGNTWRCIKDSGATAAYFWSSTFASSGAKSCVTLGDKIWGVSSTSGYIRAVKAADGTSSIHASQTNLTSDSALVMSGVRAFGICLINGSAPYKFRKFQLSDGLTPAGLPADLTLNATAVLYATTNNEGLWYFADGTSVYCYDEFWNLCWTYTNAETVSRIWQDLEQNLYVMSGTNLRCINGTDHRTVLWAVSMPATGMQVVPVSDTKLVAYGANNSVGISIVKNEHKSYVDNFQRADSNSLGNDWTDDYFFSDTGAHDYWSIKDNFAVVNGLTGSPNGGAYCSAAPACRDFDIRMSFTAGVAPTGTKGSVGPIFRGIDGRTHCYFIYVPSSGNFEYRFQDNAAAGITTSYAVNANQPVVASGGRVDLRVVCHRQLGYLWANGQGPYETAIGLLNQGKFGMFASTTAATGAQVREFRLYGNTPYPIKNQMANIWRATEIASAEYRGVNGNTHQIFRAADGRVMCFWQSRYAADPNCTWRRYWSYSASPDDLSSFTAASVINTTANIGTWYGEMTNGWIDPATDNVYAVFLSWGSTGQNIHFVKFTKTAGGWTAGSAVQIGSGLTGTTDNLSICKVPGTGRLWIAVPATSYIQAFYSDNEGSSWTQVSNLTAYFAISGTPCQLTAWNSKVMLLYKNGSYAICSKERNDSLSDKTTWGSEVSLYTSQSSSEGWHHGIWLLQSGTAQATFVMIMKTSDQKLRAKKYLEGTGWVSGDTTLADYQPSGNYSRSYWDAVRSRAIVHHANVNEPPIEYNPNGNGVVRGTEEEAPYYGSTDRLARYTYSLIKRGLAGTGAVGVHVMRMWYATYDLSLRHALQLEKLAALTPARQLPIEYLGLPLMWVITGLPLEIMGQQVHGTIKVPLDVRTTLQRTRDLTFGWRAGLWKTGGIPLDAWGIFNAIYHKWLVQRYSVDALLHLWQVLQKAGVGQVPHRWTVLTQDGEDLQHLWRVIPPELLVLHGKDIQLPFGTIEKVG